jgi:hypothetical protein
MTRTLHEQAMTRTLLDFAHANTRVRMTKPANRYPRDKRNQLLVPLSVPHRPPARFKHDMFWKESTSLKKPTLRDHEDIPIKRLRCRKAACGCYGPRTATCASWHMTPKNVVFSLIGPTQCCLFQEVSSVICFQKKKKPTL